VCPDFWQNTNFELLELLQQPSSTILSYTPTTSALMRHQLQVLCIVLEHSPQGWTVITTIFRYSLHLKDNITFQVHTLHTVWGSLAAQRLAVAGVSHCLNYLLWAEWSLSTAWLVVVLHAYLKQRMY
jgi:hypothetical protein